MLHFFLSLHYIQLLFHLWLTCLLLFCLLNWMFYTYAYMSELWCWSVLDLVLTMSVCACVHTIAMHVHHRHRLFLCIYLFLTYTHFIHQNSINEIGLVSRRYRHHTMYGYKGICTLHVCVWVCLCDTHQICQTIAQTHPINTFIRTWHEIASSFELKWIILLHNVSLFDNQWNQIN